MTDDLITFGVGIVQVGGGITLIFGGGVVSLPAKNHIMLDRACVKTWHGKILLSGQNVFLGFADTVATFCNDGIWVGGGASTPCNAVGWTISVIIAFGVSHFIACGFVVQIRRHFCPAQTLISFYITNITAPVLVNVPFKMLPLT